MTHAHGAPSPRRPSSGSPLEKLTSLALVSLAPGGAAAVLYLGHAVFIPIAYALLFALVLSAPVEALHRRGVPRGVGAVCMLLLILAAAALTLRLVWGPARARVAAIPHTVETLEQRLGPLAEALEDRFAKQSSARPAGSSVNPLVEEFEMSASGSLLVATPAVAADATTVVILALFLLAGGAPMTARLASTLVSHGKSTKALHIVAAVRSEVARYYMTIALINVGLGAATALMAFLLGLANPLLWGTIAAVLNFIPYIGSAITLLILCVESSVSFSTLPPVIAVAASFIVLVTLEGQVIEPLLVGRRLKLSPTVVLLAFWFGGWFWGIAGIVLAMPLLVTLKVVAEHVPNGRIMVELLSPSPRKSLELIERRRHPSAPPAPAAPPVTQERT